jgi:biopolymer transport protein ExbB
MTPLPPIPPVVAGCMPSAEMVLAPAVAHVRSFFELALTSGFILPLLTIAGITGIVLALRRWLELRPGRLAPEELQRSLEGKLHGADLEGGLELAAGSRTVLGDLVASGLHLRRAGLDEMLANVERATTRESLRLGNRVANLARLGGVALIVGLFGTILGLMNTLQVIEVLKEPTVADFVTGVSESLACVALGLLVGLFCFVAFFWLDSCLTQRALAVRDLAEELVRDAAEKAHVV